MIKNFKNYENVIYKHHEKTNTLEHIVTDDIINDEQSYILTIVKLAELIEYIKPKYLIINKLDSTYEITPDLISYTIKNVFNYIYKSGTKNIIFLVKKENYNEHYSNIRFFCKYLRAFTSFEKIEEWMALN